MPQSRSPLRVRPMGRFQTANRVGAFGSGLSSSDLSYFPGSRLVTRKICRPAILDTVGYSPVWGTGIKMAIQWVSRFGSRNGSPDRSGFQATKVITKGGFAIEYLATF